jgi:hypothetical protein
MNKNEKLSTFWLSTELKRQTSFIQPLSEGVESPTNRPAVRPERALSEEGIRWVGSGGRTPVEFNIFRALGL